MTQKLLNAETQVFLQSNVAGIKDMQKQLNNVNIQSSLNNNSDLQILYGRLYNQIQHFETDLSSKMNDYVAKKDKQPESINPQRKKDVQFPKIGDRFAKTTQSSLKFDKKQAIKNQDYIQNFLRNKYSLKKDQQETIINETNLNTNNNNNQQQGNGQRSGHHPPHPPHLLHPPPKILSKELRKNPFAAPPVITEQDLTTGLLQLITKGIIPKDVDLTPAFERGVPVVAKKPVTMHSNAERKMIEINYHANVKAASEQKHAQQFVVDQRTFLTQEKREEQISIEQQQQQIEQSQNKEISSIQIDKSKKEQLNLKETITNYDFLIKLGQIQLDQEGYLNCKRDYCYNWGAIQQLLTQLQEMGVKRQLHHLEINGKALAKLSLDLKKPTESDLVNCLYNKVIVSKALKGQLIRSKRNQSEREWTAAERIQSFARMRLQIQRYRLQVKQKKNISVIQSRFKMICNYQRTRKQIREKKQSMRAEFTKRQEQFKSSWKWMQQHQRVEIHMNSLSYDEFQRLSLDCFKSKQSLQIPRLFRLKDPNVELIYVSSYELPPDIKHYYTKVLELGGIENYSARVHFITPEYTGHFPPHFPTNKLLLYSHFALKQILTLIKNKPAYLVAGYPAEEDLHLCHYLNVPLLGGDPQSAYFSSTKCGARSIFEACNIPIAPAITNLTQEDQFLTQFVDLIYQYPQIGNWIFKINDEFNGRGIASFPLDSIKMLHDLKKKRQNAVAQECWTLEDEVTIKQKMKEIIQTVASSFFFYLFQFQLLPVKIKIAQPMLFHNYQEFLRFFLLKGGIIEAKPQMGASIGSPSVSFLINPDSTLQILASYDKISGQDFITIGGCYPQNSLPNLSLQTLCSNLASKLYEMGIIGYVTVDLLAFSDQSVNKQHPLFWAIGLDCFLNNYTVASFYFDFLMRGKLNNITGIYSISDEKEEQEQQQQQELLVSNNNNNKKERCFMYCPFISHLDFATLQYKTLFHLCRIESISFDLEKKSGITFVLIDELKKCVISLLTIGEDRKAIIKFMTEALNFIVAQLGPVKSNTSGSEQFRFDYINLLDIINKIRLLNKCLDMTQSF